MNPVVIFLFVIFLALRDQSKKNFPDRPYIVKKDEPIA